MGPAHRRARRRRHAEPAQPRQAPQLLLRRLRPADVARVESRTFICSENETTPARPTTGSTPPRCARPCTACSTAACAAARCTSSRSAWARSARRSPPSASRSPTSPYVVVSMRIMTRMGKAALDAIGEDGFFVPAVHSVGAPLAPGQADVAWPCNDEQVHRPLPRDPRDLVLRLRLRRQRPARQEVLRPAHRLGDGPRRGLARRAHADPQADLAGGRGARYIAAAFPSACGKTNLAMLQPTLPGWKAETVGDDICWMRFGDDGRLHAINPEAGFFGVAPGTGDATNKNAIDTLYANCIFTNVALTDDGDVWWEGPDRRRRPRTSPTGRAATGRRTPTSRPPTPTPASPPGRRSARPSRRSGKTRPACRSRPSCSAAAAPAPVPLVTEAFDWEHGVFLASNVASEGTAAAAENKIGELRRDPFAMLPFCGYNMGDYFAHWLKHRRPRPTPTSCRASTSSTGSARTSAASSSGRASARTAAS